jgi:translation elongation factor EF-G
LTTTFVLSKPQIDLLRSESNYGRYLSNEQSIRRRSHEYCRRRQESGYGDDGVVAIAAALLDADVGTATDALGTLINLLVADSGSGAEAQHVSTGTLTIIRAILSIVDAFRYSASVTERTSTALTLSDSLYTEVSNEESL